MSRSDRWQTLTDGIYAPGTKIKEERFVDSGSKWSQPGGKGTPVTITYSYSNLLNGSLPGGLNSLQIKGIVQEALGLWAKYAPLNFVEVNDSGPSPSDTGYSAGTYPQIRLGTHYIDGNSNTLAHGYYPGSSGLAGDVHFDIGDTWKNKPSGGIDLLEVTVHELGHALGLNHESTQTAIMNPYYGSRYSGTGTAFLYQDDINGIRNIYGTGVGSVNPIIPKEDQYLVGDWNGDGKGNIAVRRGYGIWMDYNFDGQADRIQYYGNGNSEDQYLVGDWNGDGKDNIAVRRGNQIWMDYNFDAWNDSIQYYGNG